MLHRTAVLASQTAVPAMSTGIDLRPAGVREEFAL